MRNLSDGDERVEHHPHHAPRAVGAEAQQVGIARRAVRGVVPQRKEQRALEHEPFGVPRRARSSRNRALASEYGLGATHPDEEMSIIRDGVNKIREDVGVYDVEIPHIPELDGAVH